MQLKIKYKILILYLVTSMFILVMIGGLLSASLREKIIQTISKNYTVQLSHIDFGLTKFIESVEQDLADLVQNEIVRSREDGDFTNFLNAREDVFQYDYGEILRAARCIVDTRNALGKSGQNNPKVVRL